MDNDKYKVTLNEIKHGTLYWHVISQIPDKSKVLECGCASGHLTKYLKERMNCRVSIVERNEEWFNTARQYAAEGYCGDLNEDKWFKYYRDEKFDFILFTDVLEHLFDPLQTLKWAKQLLRQDGKLIFSIPNICHNDIIIKMINNNFDYTRTGLLDNTHIHFWGINNLETFCTDAGFKIVRFVTINIPTNKTEQASPLFMIDPNLIRILEKRPYGTCYQYVLVCEHLTE